MSYYLRSAESLALQMLDLGGLSTFILEGAPGTGKTAFSAYAAEKMCAIYIYYQCHSWTTDEELLRGLNIPKIVVGTKDEGEVTSPGVLWQVLEFSKQGKVVLCLDELDKAPEKSEVLLLDFLQNFRIKTHDGQEIFGRKENIITFITSNNIRPLMEATYRRGFRVQMEFLPPNVEADIIRKKTGAKKGVIRFIVRMMNVIRQNGSTSPSLQEGINLALSLKAAAGVSDVTLLINGWLVKEEEDLIALKELGSCPNILWGEVNRG